MSRGIYKVTEIIKVKAELACIMVYIENPMTSKIFIIYERI